MQPTNTAVPSQDPKSRVSKNAIVGATIGGLAAVGLGLVVFLLQRRRKAYHVKEMQQKASEATDSFSRVTDNHPIYWKPELPTDTCPRQEMPLEVSPGYSLAPYEMHSSETHEMAVGPISELTHELPAIPRLRK